MHGQSNATFPRQIVNIRLNAEIAYTTPLLDADLALGATGVSPALYGT
jgi:hypothetical protein